MVIHSIIVDVYGKFFEVLFGWHNQKEIKEYLLLTTFQPKYFSMKYCKIYIEFKEFYDLF